MPVPGSSVPCRKCLGAVIVPDRSAAVTSRPSGAIPYGIPAAKLTGSKRSRGFYCPTCFTILQPGYQAARKVD